MPKVAVVVSSYNCNEVLPNTFTAISMQKVNFDYEVCFLDDCSYHDPKPLYEKYLKVPHKKGWRLKYHIGTLGYPWNFPHHPNFKNSMSMSLDMLSPDVEIVVMNHGDVIMTKNNMLQQFVDRVKDKAPVIPNVYTRKVPEDLYLYFEEGIEEYLDDINKHSLYQGIDRLSQGAMAPVLMCFLRKNLINDIEYNKSAHEHNVGAKFMQLKYEIIKIDENEMVGIHQAHKGRPSIHLINPNQLLNWGPNQPEREEY